MTYINDNWHHLFMRVTCNRTLGNFIATLLMLQKYIPTLHVKQVTKIFLSHEKIPHSMVYTQFVMPEHHFGTAFPMILGTKLLSTAFVKA